MADNTNSGIVYLEDFDSLSALPFYTQRFAQYVELRAPGSDIYGLYRLSEDWQIRDAAGWTELPMTHQITANGIASVGNALTVPDPGIYLVDATISTDGTILNGDWLLGIALQVNYTVAEEDPAFNAYYNAGTAGATAHMSQFIELGARDTVSLYCRVSKDDDEFVIIQSEHPTRGYVTHMSVTSYAGLSDS